MVGAGGGWGSVCFCDSSSSSSSSSTSVWSWSLEEEDDARSLKESGLFGMRVFKTGPNPGLELEGKDDLEARWW